MKKLPSTYIKFWWFYRKLEPRNKIDAFIIIFTAISITKKVVKIINELKTTRI